MPGGRIVPPDDSTASRDSAAGWGTEKWLLTYKLNGLNLIFLKRDEIALRLPLRPLKVEIEVLPALSIGAKLANPKLVILKGISKLTPITSAMLIIIQDGAKNGTVYVEPLNFVKY